MRLRGPGVSLLLLLSACHPAPPDRAAVPASVLAGATWTACFVRTQPPGADHMPVCGTLRFGADSGGQGTLVYRVPVQRLASWALPPEDSTVVEYRLEPHPYDARALRLRFGGRPPVCRADPADPQLCRVSDHTMELMGQGTLRGDSIRGWWRLNCGYCGDEGTFLFRRQR